MNYEPIPPQRTYTVDVKYEFAGKARPPSTIETSDGGDATISIVYAPAEILRSGEQAMAKASQRDDGVPGASGDSDSRITQPATAPWWRDEIGRLRDSNEWLAWQLKASWVYGLAATALAIAGWAR